MIKTLTLDLENCDSITIDGENVEFLACSKVSESLLCCGEYTECIKTAKNIVIDLKKEADVMHKEFGMDTYQVGTFARLADKDIVSIEIVTDDNKYEYYTLWNKDNDYYNSYQKTKITKDGHLFIVIDKKKTISDVLKEKQRIIQ